MIIINQSWWK